MFKNFYLYIFFLSLFIIIISFYNEYIFEKNSLLKEKFKLHNDNDIKLILLGDSILKNNNYVKKDYSIEAFLYKKTDNNSKCFAIDDTIVSSMDLQINKIPYYLNKENNIIFISSGGNDLLNKNVDYWKKNKEALNSLFDEYVKMIDTLKSKMNKCKIILLDIYYPPTYINYHSIIKMWNTKINDYYMNKNNGIYSVIPISKIISEPSDFISKIEPSETGGEKIANAILEYY